MITKSKISDIRLLHHKKYRDLQKQFIVEGTKSVLECINSKLSVIELFATESWFFQYEGKCPEIIARSIVSPKELERISVLTSPQEVLCIVKTPDFPIESCRNDLPIMMLDDIKDPGNMGTIIRTAEWFGLSQVVCSPASVEFTNPKVIQASMGSFCRMKVFVTSLPDFIRKQNNRNILGMCMNGHDLRHYPFQKNDILVVGSESHGISEEVQSLLTDKLHISAHTSAKTESLNASIAAGIALFAFSH